MPLNAVRGGRVTQNVKIWSRACRSNAQAGMRQPGSNFGLDLLRVRTSITQRRDHIP